jgi:hypothetical protein
MRTVEAIELDISHERAALRQASELCAAADARNDEPVYHEARKSELHHMERVDTLRAERSRARYELLSAEIDCGAFAPRFQVVADGNYYSILDIRDGREVEEGNALASAAEERAREMCHFARTREQAERRKFSFASPNRAMRPA